MSAPASAPTPVRRADARGVPYWVGLGAGTGIMLFGLRGALDHLDGPARRSWFEWLVGADVAHDALVAPAVCLVGALVARLAPRVVRAPLQGALGVTAIVLAVAYAPLRHTAEHVGNPTIQPLDYTTATLTVLGVVWGLAAVWTLARAARGLTAPGSAAGASPRTPPGPPGGRRSRSSAPRAG